MVEVIEVPNDHYINVIMGISSMLSHSAGTFRIRMEGAEVIIRHFRPDYKPIEKLFVVRENEVQVLTIPGAWNLTFIKRLQL